MKILLTNDDGYKADGINVLREELLKEHDVTLIAPKSEMSATSHSITLHREVEVVAHNIEEKIFYVDGTPSDSTKVGILDICKNVDLVISGINNGPNIGTDILYSGTFAAALEANIKGITAIAVSLNNRDRSRTPDFKAAAKKLREIINGGLLKPGKMYNINFPTCKYDEFEGVRFTYLAEIDYTDSFSKAIKDNRFVYTFGGDQICKNNDENNDFFLINKKYITVTPIKFDFNDHICLENER